MVTWMPVMAAGFAADGLCAVSCLACTWAILGSQFGDWLVAVA